MKTQKNGFSLIELMVVLVILSIVSCFSYPAYLRYGVQMKRLEGRLALLEASMQLEKYALMHPQGYAGATFEKIGVSQKTAGGWYNLSLADLGNAHYTLTAKANFRDENCTHLSCDAQGRRFYKGSGTHKDCWGD